MGFPYMDTPNLDKLVNEGVTFTNCFVPSASCAPCRASIFTGQYPHNTGVMINGNAWERSWVELLNRGGYHCVNIGKMHQAPTIRASASMSGTRSRTKTASWRAATSSTSGTRRSMFAATASRGA
ncbi:MAG: sulfatase-like hydrolase/transferase [Bryobacterales bacterium]